MVDPNELCELVERVAARHLSPTALPGADEIHKDDGSIVTLTDDAIQNDIESVLGERYPDIPFIGEEMPHALQVSVVGSNASRFWVLDPLDGTTNFVAGFPFYGVSLALVEEGAAVVGVVHDPLRGETFSAARGRGALLNGTPLRPHTVQRLGQCVANIDYKRLTRPLADRLVRSPPYRSQRNLGSCVLEWCWLAAGRFQLYLHGGQKLWDYAAGSLILAEAGGAASGFEGRMLDCHSLSKRSVIAAASPELHALWSGWITRQGCLSVPAGGAGQGG